MTRRTTRSRKKTLQRPRYCLFILTFATFSRLLICTGCPLLNQLRALAVPEGGYGEDEDVANAEDEAYLEVRERSDRG